MKRNNYIAVSGLSVAICLLVMGNATAQVVNPGFETAGGTGTGAANWNSGGGGGAISSATRTSVDPFSGSFELDLEGQGDGAGGSAAIAFQNSVPAVAGANTFSFWTKGGLTLGGANPQWQIVWFNAANAVIGSAGFTSFSGSVGASYAQVSVPLTAPVGTDHADITFLLAVGAGTGDHWLVRIDDVSLAVVPEPTTMTLVGMGLFGAMMLAARKRKS